LAITKRKIALGSVDGNRLSPSSVRAIELRFFLSAEQTGDGTEQSIAHGLGATPTLVLIIITGSPATYAALTVTEGTHDATYARVTVTSGWRYKVFAMP